MPDALNLAQIRSVRLSRSLAQWCGLVLVLSTTALSAQERRISFDIPAQPLAGALAEFADKSGMAALIDDELTRGLRSSPVKGDLSPSDGLRVLLAGTELSIRYAGAGAFTVGLATPEQSRGTPRPRTGIGRRGDYEAYFSQVQSALSRVLCRSDDIRPGPYRAAFQIWVGDDGAVRALHFLGASGDEARDATITAVLTKASVAPPPRDLPQPLTVILQPRAPGADCAGLSDSRP